VSLNKLIIELQDYMMHLPTHFVNFNKAIEHHIALSCISNESYMKHKRKVNHAFTCQTCI